jgi:hypothetical protein
MTVNVESKSGAPEVTWTITNVKPWTKMGIIYYISPNRIYLGTKNSFVNSGEFLQYVRTKTITLNFESDDFDKYVTFRAMFLYDNGTKEFAFLHNRILTDPATTTPASTTAASTTSIQTYFPTTPAATTPGRTTPAATTPGQTTPAATTPGQTTPAATTPGQTTAAATTPGQTTAAATTPGQTTAAATTPGQTTPAITAAASTTSIQTYFPTTPASTTPGQTTAAATTPGQTTAAPILNDRRIRTSGGYCYNKNNTVNCTGSNQRGKIIETSTNSDGLFEMRWKWKENRDPGCYYSLNYDNRFQCLNEVDLGFKKGQFINQDNFLHARKGDENLPCRGASNGIGITCDEGLVSNVEII